MADVFARIEKKYLMTRAQYEALRPIIDAEMVEDAYGLHTICNLYMDTDDYALIRESIDKPLYKEKLRLRSYGTPKADAPVFLEIKKKFKGIVYKRRSAMPLEHAMHYLRTGDMPDKTTQIMQEIDWFTHRVSLTPKVCLCYDRMALYHPGDTSLRMTFDTDIRWRTSRLDLAKGSWGAPLLDDDSVLMEIKCSASMPLWLVRALSALEIAPTSFSKYGECYKRYLIHETAAEGAVAYAS